MSNIESKSKGSFESACEGKPDVEIASPCIRNCCLDTTEICLGCFRSLPEILKWNNATVPEKREILIQCNLRKNARGTRWRN